MTVSYTHQLEVENKRLKKMVIEIFNEYCKAVREKK